MMQERMIYGLCDAEQKKEMRSRRRRGRIAPLVPLIIVMETNLLAFSRIGRAHLCLDNNKFDKKFNILCAISLTFKCDSTAAFTANANTRSDERYFDKH